MAILTPVFSQEEKTVPEIPEPVTTKKDTSTVHMNGKKIIIIKDVDIEDDNDYGSTDVRVVSVYHSGRNRVWQGFEIGFTGVSYTPDFNTNIPPGLEHFDPNVGGSINWAINPFELDVRIVKEYVKFSTGLGYAVRNFDLNNNYVLTKDANDNTVGYQDSTRTLTRNRFRTGYLTMPAMLYFNTNSNPNKAFRIGAGVVGGVKIFEAYRLKHYDDGHRTREKYNGGYNANPFILDLRAVVGFGSVNFYATYATQTLFNSGKGPEVYPFTFGISFGGSY
jgi:hypothetical protein